MKQAQQVPAEAEAREPARGVARILGEVPTCAWREALKCEPELVIWNVDPHAKLVRPGGSIFADDRYVPVPQYTADFEGISGEIVG